MAPFDPDTDPDQDFHLFESGPVVLYHQPHVLGAEADRLAAHGYLIHRLDAGAWTTRADFHRAVARELGFPAHYGHNLDAFDDCLRAVATHGHAVGTVLVFDGYDTFARHEPRAAQTVLDIVAGRARTGLLFGHRMLCLVRSTDPELHFDPVGATAVGWNPAER